MRAAYIKMHIAIFLWGFTGIFGRLISLQEGLLVWYRIFFTVVFLGLLLYFKNELERLSWQKFWKIAITGGIIALHWVTFFGAIKFSNVSIALSCLASSALFTAIIEPLVNKRKINFGEIIFGLLTIFGIYLIFRFETVYYTGIILALISALLAATFTIINKRLLDHHTPSNLVFYELGSGLIVLTFVLPFYNEFSPAQHLFPQSTDWLWLLILSLVCTVYAMRISYEALKEVTPFTMNLSINLEPVYGIILAAIIFAEQKEVSLEFYLGAAIIIFSVALHSLYRFRVRKKTKL